MIEIDTENVIGYLRDTGRLEEKLPARAFPLAWGVSNIVLRIEPERGEHFVIKQSRAQLRTQADWFSRLERIFREMDALAALASLLPAGIVPRVLFEDRENYLFGMQAIPADHIVWKAELLEGRADLDVARTAADDLAMIHCRSFGERSLRRQFEDRGVFDELRIDPFYRHIAAAQPAVAPAVSRLIEEMLATPICLVHADFSPKNILIVPDAQTGARRLALVDFETAHYGDPAFDLGFFFSHLLLKSVLHAGRVVEFLNLAREFHARYFAAIDRLGAAGPMSRPSLDRRSVHHAAACMLARIDGKSTVDYLRASTDRNEVRRFCLDLLADPPERLEAVFDRLGQLRR